MSFVERLFLLCPLFGGSFIGGSTVYYFYYFVIIDVLSGPFDNGGIVSVV